MEAASLDCRPPTAIHLHATIAEMISAAIFSTNGEKHFEYAASMIPIQWERGPSIHKGGQIPGARYFMLRRSAT